MEVTKVPYVFDFTRPPPFINLSTEDPLIPVNLSMDEIFPLPVNLSLVPSYSQIPVYEPEPVTLEPVQEGMQTLQA